jgi:hypothetical protein
VFAQAAAGATADQAPIWAPVPGMSDHCFFPDAVHALVTGITLNDADWVHCEAYASHRDSVAAVMWAPLSVGTEGNFSRDTE